MANVSQHTHHSGNQRAGCFATENCEITLVRAGEDAAVVTNENLISRYIGDVQIQKTELELIPAEVSLPAAAFWSSASSVIPRRPICGWCKMLLKELLPMSWLTLPDCLHRHENLKTLRGLAF